MHLSAARGRYWPSPNWIGTRSLHAYENQMINVDVLIAEA
jgi:hypothetical protein